MSTAFTKISFESKRFINEWTFVSSTFAITGDVLRNSWVGEALTLKSPVNALKTCVFPAPAPILLCLIILSDLLLPSAPTLLLLKRRVRSKEPLTLGFFVFFLTLRAQGMRRRWIRRRTRRSFPSLLFTLLLASFLSSSKWRTSLGKRGCARPFPCLFFLERFVPFWTKISLDNYLLYF